MSGLEPTVTVEGEASALSPTQKIVRDAHRIEYGTDALGRKLGVVRLSGALRRRVTDVLSKASNEKDEKKLMSLLACACVSIDDAAVHFPAGEIQVNALIDRLDNEGMAAIADIIGTRFPAAGEEAIKNS
jgi:hypothetical protein